MWSVISNWIRSSFAQPADVDPDLLLDEPTEDPPDPLALNRALAVERARRLAAVPATYKLGAGGRSPTAKTPFTTRDGVLGCDCVGFTSWCLGHDRYQPGRFPFYDGWINTDSLMMDAKGKRTWYAPIALPEPGDVVVYPSIWTNGIRTRMGHIGLICEVISPPSLDVFTSTNRGIQLSMIRVIDCASRRGTRAIAETGANSAWSKPDAMFARLVNLPDGKI